MMIGKTATGDQAHRYNRCLVVPFEGKRKVMSTAMENGGYQENLTAIFNRDVNPGPGKPCLYCQPGQEEEIRRFINEELGLNSETVAYMATIVSMDSAVMKSETYDELTVTTISTASLEVNGGRVGEKATSYEKNGQSVSLRPGTINIMVFISGNMTPGCMARAMVTATEAKTAACQELLAGSLNSSGIATGSGTDNVMIISNSESENTLTYAGKHGKLGELIGRLVMTTVTESLAKHMGLSQKSQHSMLARLKRYGIDESTYADKYGELTVDDKKSMPDFINVIHLWDCQDELVTLTSLYVHLLDQLSWELLSIEEVCIAGKAVLNNLSHQIGTDLKWQEVGSINKDECIKVMLDSFVTTTAMAAVTNEIN